MKKWCRRRDNPVLHLKLIRTVLVETENGNYYLGVAYKIIAMKSCAYPNTSGNVLLYLKNTLKNLLLLGFKSGTSGLAWARLECSVKLPTYITGMRVLNVPVSGRASWIRTSAVAEFFMRLFKSSKVSTHIGNTT